MLRILPRRHFFTTLLLLCLGSFTVFAQDPVTGAFEGTVTNRQGGAAITGAIVQFINTMTEVPVARRSDAQGRFYQGLLPPGIYRIRVSAAGFKTTIVEQRLLATRPNSVVPVPVVLEPDVAVAPPTPPANATAGATVTPPPPVVTPPAPAAPVVRVSGAAELSATDGRRGGVFTDDDVTALPLGDTTLTRSFDSFALFIPGLALPPQTAGRIAGPGVGAGVGSAGQFSANGLRSRANNFLVDGSDNNDEDIGVRRQGFFALVPQPIESIKEYQVITALAPAQYGRNLGALVNVISKSGGYQTHGSVYGFLNTSRMNARDFFDMTSSGVATQLTGLTPQGESRNVFITDRITTPNTRLARRPLLVSNPAFKKDSQTLGQTGFVLGGPLLPKQQTSLNESKSNSGKSAFYFLSFEGQVYNANLEKSFAVPTVEERGFLNSGATGFNSAGGETFPTTLQGDAIFSLYPFPNNSNGVYARNTYTQLLPADARGYVASIKMEHNFQAWGRSQSVTGRYNRTHDWRNIPGTGDALFATLRPVTGTQNISLFHNSELTASDANSPVFNQVRVSFGRTRLNFEEERDQETLIPSSRFPSTPFLLNSLFTFNNNFLSSNDPTIEYGRAIDRDTERGGLFQGKVGGRLGPIGQVILPGFSPLGVDVNFFPQKRVNNTYQVADTLTWRKTEHSFAVGADIRRTQLNSDLPRNARTRLVFSGAPRLIFDLSDDLKISNFRLGSDFLPPSSLAAVAAPSSSFTTLQTTGTSNIGLRYTQSNFFGQDEWRIRPNISLAYGLRYEFNSPPTEVNRAIEKSFTSTSLDLPGVSGLKQFIDGRKGIYDPDRNNLSPRVGLAYSHSFRNNWELVMRGGYGIYYDQILGAVTSQSRNVFPNFLTINTGGGAGSFVDSSGVRIFLYDIFNAGDSPNTGIQFRDGTFAPYVIPGTLNQFNQNIPLETLVNVLNREFGNAFGFTLPHRVLPTPKAHQYSFSVEQRLGAKLAASVSYVGTQGRNLLRLTTPNLGPNLTTIPATVVGRGGSLLPIVGVDEDGNPQLFGSLLGPGQRVLPSGITGGRPIANAGTVYLYETTATSRYDSLQAQLRGQLEAVSFQISYTFSKALDDVSDVFDLAGAPSLPQNSLRPSERGLANFDTRHRFTYTFNWALPKLNGKSKAAQLLFGGFEFAGTGQYQTGQPFTINSIFDVNLDGNLTDRLNTTKGLAYTGNRRQPIRLTAADAAALRAAIGNTGAVGRNTFRSSGYLLLNVALTKNFIFTETQRLILRVEAFNFLNRANFALPVRLLEAPSFGESVDTLTPGRRIQLALKYQF